VTNKLQYIVKLHKAVSARRPNAACKSRSEEAKVQLYWNDNAISAKKYNEPESIVQL
jgi:hypothetical protein